MTSVRVWYLEFGMYVLVVLNWNSRLGCLRLILKTEFIPGIIPQRLLISETHFVGLWLEDHDHRLNCSGLFWTWYRLVYHNII